LQNVHPDHNALIFDDLLRAQWSGI